MVQAHHRVAKARRCLAAIRDGLEDTTADGEPGSPRLSDSSDRPFFMDQFYGLVKNKWRQMSNVEIA